MRKCLVTPPPPSPALSTADSIERPLPVQCSGVHALQHLGVRVAWHSSSSAALPSARWRLTSWSPAEVGTTLMSGLRYFASAVTSGRGLSGWAAATVLAACSAACSGLSPKWMIYLPASAQSSLSELPGLKSYLSSRAICTEQLVRAAWLKSCLHRAACQSCLGSRASYLGSTAICTLAACHLQSLLVQALSMT